LNALLADSPARPYRRAASDAARYGMNVVPPEVNGPDLVADNDAVVALHDARQVA
jgi:hypothetical protein